MGSRWRDCRWWRGILDYNDFSEAAIAVDLLNLAVADGVLMGAFPLPHRPGRSRDGAGTADAVERLVSVLGEELGRQRVDRRHCLGRRIRRGGRR
jgi:hypothetical protein